MRAATVLVVDDDPDVLAPSSMVLDGEGYTVLEAMNGAEGIEVLEAHPEIDLLFTDIVMPGEIDGFELARRAKQLRPSVRVLYTSGYLKNVSAGEVRYGPLLAKPWRQEQLRQSIGALLTGGGSTPGLA